MFLDQKSIIREVMERGLEQIPESITSASKWQFYIYLKLVLIVTELNKSNCVMVDTTVNLYFGINGKYEL